MMGGPSFAEFIILILVYIAGAMLMTVMVGVGIALGLRWGGKWLLKAIYSNAEFEKWLKRVLNASEKPNYSDTAESATDVSNRSN